MPPQEALIRQLYIKVDGTQVESAIMDGLYRVEVDSDLHLPDMCLLSIHDEGARWTNEGPFTLGAELRVGVADAQGRGENPLFIGEITAIEPEFGDGTVADLRVRAYDRTHRLHRGRHVKTYQDSTDSAIASTVARDADLQADVDATSVTHKHVYQHGQTHWEFLTQRARLIGYDVYVQDRTLCFKRSQPGATVALEWGAQLKEFHPVMTLDSQVSEVKVLGWDPTAKREVTGTAQRGQVAPELEQSANGGQIAEQAFGAANDLVVRAAVASGAEADAVAQAVLNERESSFVQAEGRCIGQPTLKAGCIAELSALGRRFNGRYRITSARHIWATDQDYQTWFRVSGRKTDTLRELLGVPGADEATRWPLMTAIVTNNDDPDNQGRVRVRYKWLDEQGESAWARIAALGAGPDRGAYWAPEVEDEVVVAFEQGDFGRPIVLGGLWNGQDATAIPKSDAIVNGRVVQRVFITRAGHKLIFKDENPAQIQLVSVGGHSILIDDDAAKIEIKTSGGNTLRLDDNGRTIRIEGAGGLEVQARQDITLRASGQMNLEASGNVTIRGAMIQLNP